MFCKHDWNKVEKETDSYYWEFKFCVKCGKWKAHCGAKVSKKLEKDFSRWIGEQRKELGQWMMR